MNFPSHITKKDEMNSFINLCTKHFSINLSKQWLSISYINYSLFIKIIFIFL